MKNLYDLDAERALLSALMQDMNTFQECKLLVSDFYDQRNQIIYQGLKEMQDAGIPFDILLISDHIGTKVPALYLSTTQTYCPIPSNIGHYARIVQELSVRRQLHRLASELTLNCTDNDIDINSLKDRFQSEIFSVSNREGSNIKHIRDILPRVIDEIDSAYNSNTPPGISTGFRDFDSRIGRFQPGMQIIIAGRPGMGKSSIIRIHMEAAINAGIPVGLVSIEMPESEIVKRFLSGATGVSYTDIQAGRGNFRSVCEAARDLADKPIYFTVGSKSKISSIIQESRRMKRQYNIGLLIIDYLQLIAVDKSMKREEDVAEISRRLKNLAVELNIPILCVAQLNRQCESRENKRPVLADLRESGSLEQDADMVIFLYRDSYYNRSANSGVAELIIAKHRNGRTGVLEVAWLPQTMTFRDLSRNIEEN